jgi:hypothetical protein
VLVLVLVLLLLMVFFAGPVAFAIINVIIVVTMGFFCPPTHLPALSLSMLQIKG